MCSLSVLVLELRAAVSSSMRLRPKDLPIVESIVLVEKTRSLTPSNEEDDGEHIFNDVSVSSSVFVVAWSKPDGGGEIAMTFEGGEERRRWPCGLPSAVSTGGNLNERSPSCDSNGGADRSVRLEDNDVSGRRSGLGPVLPSNCLMRLVRREMVSGGRMLVLPKEASESLALSIGDMTSGENI